MSNQSKAHEEIFSEKLAKRHKCIGSQSLVPVLVELCHWQYWESPHVSDSQEFKTSKQNQVNTGSTQAQFKMQFVVLENQLNGQDRQTKDAHVQACGEVMSGGKGRRGMVLQTGNLHRMSVWN